MKAFTLIELIVVVAILGILSSIAVPQFNKALVRANVARAQGDMAALHHALMAFANDHHDMFPLIRQDFYKGASGGEAKTRLERLAPLTSPVAYISAIPRDPFVNGGWRVIPVPCHPMMYLSIGMKKQQKNIGMPTPSLRFLP